MSSANTHIRACQSPLPVASILPAGLRSMEMTAYRSNQYHLAIDSDEQYGLTRVLVPLEHALHDGAP